MFQCIIKQVKTKWKIFRQSWTKHLETFSLFSTICLHHKWNGTRLLSPENECTSYLTSCRATFSPLGGSMCPHKKKKTFQENFKKIPEMLGFDGEYPAVHPIARFWRFLVKKCKKSAVKCSIEKPILLNFVNLPPTFCSRLWVLEKSGTTGNFEIFRYT